MNTLSGSVTFKVIKGSGNPMTRLMSDKLLSQFRETGSPALKPDWTVVANQPTVWPQILAQETGTLIVGSAIDSSSVKWYWRGTEITFTANVATGTYAGKFAKTTTLINGQSVPALKITGNIMDGLAANDVIGFECRVKSSTSANYIPVAANISVTIDEVSAGAYKGYITAGDGSVSQSSPTERLTATLLRGATEVTSGVSYKWYRWDNAWAEIAGQTAKYLDVTLDMVDGSETFKVEFTVGGSIVASDQADIIDESDPFRVVFSTIPAAFTGFESAGPNSSMTLTPKVYNGATDKTSEWKITSIGVIDASGNTLKTNANPTDGVTSISVLYSDVVNAISDDVTFVVDAVKK